MKKIKECTNRHNGALCFEGKNATENFINVTYIPQMKVI